MISIKKIALSAVIPILFSFSCSDDSFVTSESLKRGALASKQDTTDVVTPRSGTAAKVSTLERSKQLNEEIPPLPTDVATNSAVAAVAKCETSTPIVGKAEVIFPERIAANVADPTTLQCKWGLDGNNPNLINEEITARAEISKPIDVPAGAVLCSMEISSAQDNFEYDDHIALTFGGQDSNLVEQKEYVLISNMEGPKFFEQEGGLSVYQWEILNSPTGKKGLKGAKFSELNEGSHCPPDSLLCNLPRTQTEGSLKLKLSPDVNKNLMIIGAKYNNYQLNLIITGDDNMPVDCQHKELKLNVDYTYIIP